MIREPSDTALYYKNYILALGGVVLCIIYALHITNRQRHQKSIYSIADITYSALEKIKQAEQNPMRWDGKQSSLVSYVRDVGYANTCLRLELRELAKRYEDYTSYKYVESFSEAIYFFGEYYGGSNNSDQSKNEATNLETIIYEQSKQLGQFESTLRFMYDRFMDFFELYKDYLSPDEKKEFLERDNALRSACDTETSSE